MSLSSLPIPSTHSHLHQPLIPLPSTMSNNESISNKVGNATDGAVGSQTLLDQGKTLATHTIDYAKGVAGLGAAKPAGSVDSALHDSQGEKGSQTLGDLVNETRELAAAVLATAQTVVAGATDKTKEVLGDVKDSNAEGKPVGYVEQARGLAASALGTAHDLIAVGQQKVGEVANSDAANDLTNKAAAKAGDVSDSAKSTANSAGAKLSDAQKQASSLSSAASKEFDNAKDSAKDSANQTAASINKKF
ncbi:hypothetical protein P7C70_g650, partial [Phenoliferia sp. Uapishka_3]